MIFFEKYQEILHKGTDIIQIIGYTISFLLISISIIKSSIIYFSEYVDPKIDDTSNFINARLNLGESTALALSFILGVEILRLFFIKTYKQLVFVISLVIVKLIISWFLLQEINKVNQDKLNEKNK
jgi:uncharacterized membrane protein